MKNRFYDAKMHGADWNAVREDVRAAARLPRRRGRAAHDHDDDDRPAQRVAHRRQRRAQSDAGGRCRRAIRASISSPIASGFYKVGHIYKNGPADHDYLKIKKGNFVVSVDDHDLKTSDNYWRYFTLAPARKFHFLINDKPAKDGAWDVTITPVAGTAFGDLQYARWVGRVGATW